MASITRIAGSAATEANGGNRNFSNPSYITADDTNYASVQSASGNTLSYRIYGYNFGFAIPSGSTINGIIATINCYSTLSGDGDCANWHGVWIRKSDASFGSTNKGSGSIPTSLSDVSFGGNTDLWGVSSWAASDINDADFGVGVQFDIFYGGVDSPKYVIAYIDYIKLTVYYTPPGPAGLYTFNGLSKASVKVVNELAIASVKSVDGLV